MQTITKRQRPRAWIRSAMIGFVAAVGAVGLVLACGGAVTSGGTDSNTHWLTTCRDDVDCGSALECHCGVCTRVCDASAQCSSWSEAARCVDPEALVGATECVDLRPRERTCALTCEASPDCDEYGAGFSCINGQCLRAGEAGSPRPDGGVGIGGTGGFGETAMGGSAHSYPAPVPGEDLVCDTGIHCGVLACAADSLPVPVSTSAFGAPCCVCGASTELPRPDCEAGPAVDLDAEVLATRLADLLWHTSADAALIARAATVSTQNGLGCLAREMLEDDRAHFGLRLFAGEWLGLGAPVPADTELFQMSPEIELSMQTETAFLVSDLILGDNPTARELLQTDVSFVDANLRRLYGLETTSSEEFERAILDANRPGLLTRSSFLATNANRYYGSPTQRGRSLLDRVSCVGIPDDPEGTREANQPDFVTETTRAAYEEMLDESLCVTCHERVDRLGFAFENFDAIGRYREEENGVPIDASGMARVKGIDIPFADQHGLVEILASNSDFAECFSLRWLEYLVDRPGLHYLTGSDADREPEVILSFRHVLRRGLLAQGFSLREAVVAGFETDLFQSHVAEAEP